MLSLVLFLLGVTPDAKKAPTLSVEDPDLGELYLKEKNDAIDTIERLPLPKPLPTTYVNLNTSYLRKANLLSGFQIPTESYWSSSASLFNSTQLGNRTFLLSSLNVAAVKFVSNKDFDYTEIQPQVGVYQVIGNSSYAAAYLAYAVRQGDLVGSEGSAKVTVGTTLPLSPRLDAKTAYELRYSFGDRDRLQHALSYSLVWKVSPSTTLSLDNQALFSDFTQTAQADFFGFSALGLRQNLSPSTALNVFAGYNWLRSTSPSLDSHGYVFGVGLNFQQGLF